MKCWYTLSRFGILNNSYATPADIKSDCCVVNYKGTLFCAYIAEGSDQNVKFISKPSAAGWGNPLEVGAESLSGSPAVFVFRNKLYVLCSGRHIVREQSVSAHLAEYDDLTGRFTVTEFAAQFVGGPSLVEHNEQLYMFYKEPDSTTVLWKSTRDMVNWSEAKPVKIDGALNLSCALDPVAISYQGLIHLVANNELGKGSLLIKFDGDTAWTRARTWITRDYSSPPGLAIHNGLLKVAFSGWKGNLSTRAIDLYGYDGNAISEPDTSMRLGAKFRVSMAVQDGILYVLYHGQD